MTGGYVLHRIYAKGHDLRDFGWALRYARRKFRAQVGRSPLRFLSFLTEFWGLRLGIKDYGFFNIDRLIYVVEKGAGSF
jgi:hypothetical protein